MPLPKLPKLYKTLSLSHTHNKTCIPRGIWQLGSWSESYSITSRRRLQQLKRCPPYHSFKTLLGNRTFLLHQSETNELYGAFGYLILYNSLKGKKLNFITAVIIIKVANESFQEWHSSAIVVVIMSSNFLPRHQFNNSLKKFLHLCIKRGILKAKAMTKIINSTYQILAWSCAFHLVYLWGMSRPYLSLTQQCAVSLPTYLSRNVSPLYLRMSIFAKSCMEKIFGQMPWWRSSGQRARLVLQRPKFESLWSLQFFCSFQNPGSNLATINFYWAFALCQLLRKDEKLRKRGQEWPIFNYLS